MELHYAMYTDIGGRKQNEDTVLTAEHKDGRLFVAADGLGGYEAGELASRMTASMLEQAFQADGAGTDLKKVLCDVNRRILEEQAAAGKRMMTTAAVVIAAEEHLYLAHVGDTRIYAFREGRIVHQTLDHSVPQGAVERGEITPEQIRSHPERSMLTQALGAAEAVNVVTEELLTAETDALLLCTDGFWEYILEADMTAALRLSHSPGEWLNAMRGLLPGRVRGQNDNNSAIAVMVSQDPVRISGLT